MDVIKYVDLVEHIRMENEKSVIQPVRKAAAMAVIKKPFASRYEKEEISIQDGLR